MSDDKQLQHKVDEAVRLYRLELARQRSLADAANLSDTERQEAEREWLQWSTPNRLLKYLRGKASARKWRLFSAACCRSVWDLLIDAHCRKAVEVVERFADGVATEEELSAAQAHTHPPLWHLKEGFYSAQESAHQATVFAAAYYGQVNWRVCSRSETIHPFPPEQCASAVFEAVSCDARRQALPKDQANAVRTITCINQCNLLRDVVGNPFRPTTLAPAYLTPTVVSLAHAAYEERHLPDGRLDSTLLAVLADALEEAGCDNPDILDHCRQPGKHVRGCWAVDLVLGRE